MPHTIRDYFLNQTLVSRNYTPTSPYNTIGASSAFGLNTQNGTSSSSGSSSSSTATATTATRNTPLRGYSSTYNTTYNASPASLSRYSYTTRFLHRPAPTPSSASAPAATSSTQGSAPRMPQTPPLQHQQYTGTAAAAGDSAPGSHYNGTGYSSTYYGGGNSDRYNANYSSHHILSGGGHGIGGATHSKTVCRMDCRYCSAVVCLRGMKAMLLADTSVELYSTDHPPGSVQLIDKDYTTSNCKCKIRDVACRVCGNIVGYHITQPCQQCLKAPNNGHFWMFHTEGVVGQERLSMDLGKLVQELVSHPHPSPRDSPAHTSFQQHVSLTPAIAPAPDQHHTEAATTRLTSLSRIQRQQRQTLHQHLDRPQESESRVFTASPSPVTPTPSTPTPSLARAGPVISLLPAPMAAARATPNALREDIDSPSRSASATLEMLNVSLFLQPMKWEQLPHPDLDIDLDPNTMGGEPLFAGQWTDLVTRTAEAAAANMCLALDQEEETEQFLEQMVHEQTMHVEGNDHDNAEASSTTGSLELLPEHQLPSTAEGESIEQLIEQVDEFGLASPIRAPDVPKDDEPEDVEMSRADLRWSQRERLDDRQEEAQPDVAPVPGQQGASPSSSSPASTEELPAPDSDESGAPGRSASTSADSSVVPSLKGCPEFAMISATVAKAAASAAAADAASAASSLLYGRRARREYDMMCR